MRIAVVGAGVSGVTCARELHELGHEVEVFEKSNADKSTRPRQMEGSVNLLQNIPEIEPDGYMKKIRLHSPKFTVSGWGKYGYFYEVGGANGIELRARKSIEGRLPIHYSTKIENKAQLAKFEVVVAADGHHSFLARQAGLFASDRPSQVGVGIGYTISGEFDPELIEVWVDNDLSLHGYAYLIPFSQNEACLVSVLRGKTVNAFPYRENLKKVALLRGWERLDEWVDFENWYDYSSYCVDNLYVVGNAGSFTDPAFGFGLKWAIQSAKLCAKAIDESVDYNFLVRKELLPDLDSFQIMKKFLDNASNDDYDRFVEKLENPLVKKIVDSGRSFFKHKRLMRTVFSLGLHRKSREGSVF
jgi:digeranylgeranylglycerophospholipid reductase